MASSAVLRHLDHIVKSGSHSTTQSSLLFQGNQLHCERANCSWPFRILTACTRNSSVELYKSKAQSKTNLLRMHFFNFQGGGDDSDLRSVVVGGELTSVLPITISGVHVRSARIGSQVHAHLTAISVPSPSEDFFIERPSSAHGATNRLVYTQMACITYRRRRSNIEGFSSAACPLPRTLPKYECCARRQRQPLKRLRMRNDLLSYTLLSSPPREMPESQYVCVLYAEFNLESSFSGFSPFMIHQRIIQEHRLFSKSAAPSPLVFPKKTS